MVPNMMKDEEDTDLAKYHASGKPDLAKYHASGKPFRLFWVGIGQNDFFLQSSHATVALLNKYGIRTEVLKDYPNLFAPLLFTEPQAH
jgi:Fe-S oxidoreductase